MRLCKTGVRMSLRVRVPIILEYAARSFVAMEFLRKRVFSVSLGGKRLSSCPQRGRLTCFGYFLLDGLFQEVGCFLVCCGVRERGENVFKKETSYPQRVAQTIAPNRQPL